MSNPQCTPGERKLIPENPLLVLPSLAVRLGLNGALIIQQIQYWLANTKVEGIVIDKEKWIPMTQREWLDNFPFLALNTIRNAKNKLIEDGLLLERTNPAQPADQRNFYRINYEHLDARLAEPLEKPKRKARADHPNFGQWAYENKLANKETGSPIQTLDGSPIQTLDDDRARDSSSSLETNKKDYFASPDQAKQEATVSSFYGGAQALYKRLKQEHLITGACGRVIKDANGELKASAAAPAYALADADVLVRAGVARFVSPVHERGLALVETDEAKIAEVQEGLKELADEPTPVPAPSKAPRLPRKAAEHDVLFKHIGTDILNYAPENGTKYTRSQCQLINSIKGAIMRVMELQKTEADYKRGVNAIAPYKAWYKRVYPDRSPALHATFETFFKEWWDAEGKPQAANDQPRCPTCQGDKKILERQADGSTLAVTCPTCHGEAVYA